jgi:hypothetical protein
MAVLMQLVQNQLPAERLIVSMEAPNIGPVVEAADSPFVLKGANTMSGNSRWLFFGALIGAMLFSVGGIVFRQYRDKDGQPLHFPTFVRARTQSLGTPGSNASPAPIVIQLSTDMVRVSAIALGHPRLAVINGKTVTEGDGVTLQAPNSAVALILRVAKIGDGSIDLTDGKQLFSAKLSIPSPPKPKTR